MHFCLTSYHTSLAELLNDRQFEPVRERADLLVELRADAYLPVRVADICLAIDHFGPQRCVLTCRSVSQGGKSCLTATQRQQLRHAAIKKGVAYVDVELHEIDEDLALFAKLQAQVAASSGCTRLIVSHHALGKVPSFTQLRVWRRHAEALGAHVVKLVIKPSIITDALPLLRLLQETTGWQVPLLGIAWGTCGLWSRVLANKFAYAPPFVFACTANQAQQSSGQVVWQELLERYRFAQITPEWPVYGVIGDPVAHSHSPAFHNEALQAANLPGVYLPFHVQGQPLSFLRDMAPCLGVRGLSVTMPHKASAMVACQSLSLAAQGMQAVNTLLRVGDNGWHGDNTDGAAAVFCMQNKLPQGQTLRDQTVLIMGAGGTAKAIAQALLHAGAHLLICNRSIKHAQALADRVGGRVVRRADIPQLSKKMTIVVNATSLGMAPHIDQTPLEGHEIPRGCLVFDSVYTPAKTLLLHLAAQQGCTIVDGVEFFNKQAQLQFELFQAINDI